MKKTLKNLLLATASTAMVLATSCRTLNKNTKNTTVVLTDREIQKINTPTSKKEAVYKYVMENSSIMYKCINIGEVNEATGKRKCTYEDVGGNYLFYTEIDKSVSVEDLKYGFIEGKEGKHGDINYDIHPISKSLTPELHDYASSITSKKAKISFNGLDGNSKKDTIPLPEFVIIREKITDYLREKRTKRAHEMGKNSYKLEHSATYRNNRTFGI